MTLFYLTLFIEILEGQLGIYCGRENREHDPINY